MSIKHEDLGEKELEIFADAPTILDQNLRTELSDADLDFSINIPVQYVTWNELLYMHDNNLALRHVSFLSRAQDEMKNGIKDGDAVSLSCPQKFIRHDDGLPEIYQQFADTEYTEPKYTNLPIFLVNKNSQQEISLSFELSVKEFIKESIKMDLNSFATNGISTMDALNNILSSGSSFLICRFPGAENPYELDQYFNLGKCGKNNVSSENIIDLICISEHENEINREMNLSGAGLSEPLTRITHDLIATCIADVVWDRFCHLISENQSKNK